MQISNIQLLQEAALKLQEKIIPDLSSGDVIDDASTTVLLLNRISGRLGLLVGCTQKNLPGYQASLGSLIGCLPETGGQAQKYQQMLESALKKVDEDPVAAFLDLREIGALIIRHFATEQSGWLDSGEELAKHVMALIAVDQQWRAQYNTALNQQIAQFAEARKDGRGGKTVYDLVTKNAMTAYLRQHFPDSPQLEVTGVSILPGGRSKHTIFLTLTGTEQLPGEVVMRQDIGKVNLPTYVKNEFPLLKSAYQHGVPVPQVYHLQAQPTELGGPFILMGKLSGTNPGGYFDYAGGSRELVANIAGTLGKMHAIDVTTIELPESLSLDHQNYLLDEIAYFRKQWQDNALEQSPIIEYAYAWLDREVRRGIGGPALVHGDFAAHNYLAQGDRLSGILDWEFAHIGDPAFDVAYRRPYFETYMPMEEFLDIYYQQGAAELDERRLKMFAVWGPIRNAAFGALGHRRFQLGLENDYWEGAISTFLYDYMDQEVAQLLDG